MEGKNHLLSAWTIKLINTLQEVLKSPKVSLEPLPTWTTLVKMIKQQNKKYSHSTAIVLAQHQIIRDRETHIEVSFENSHKTKALCLKYDNIHKMGAVVENIERCGINRRSSRI